MLPAASGSAAGIPLEDEDVLHTCDDVLAALDMALRGGSELEGADDMAIDIADDLGWGNCSVPASTVPAAAPPLMPSEATSQLVDQHQPAVVMATASATAMPMGGIAQSLQLPMAPAFMPAQRMQSESQPTMLPMATAAVISPSAAVAPKGLHRHQAALDMYPSLRAPCAERGARLLPLALLLCLALFPPLLRL